MAAKSRSLVRVLVAVALASSFVLMLLPNVAADTYLDYNVRVTASGSNMGCTLTYQGTDPMYVARGYHFSIGFSYWLYAPGWFDYAYATGWINDLTSTAKSVSTNAGPISGWVTWDIVYPNPGYYYLVLSVNDGASNYGFATCGNPTASHTFTVYVS